MIKGYNLPAAFIEATLHRASDPPNMPGEQSPSETEPNGGSPWEGRRAPVQQSMEKF
jgi:hypothetical protein